MCIVFCLHILSVNYKFAMSLEARRRPQIAPELELQMVMICLCECSELNLCPLEDQPVLVTAEPSL